MPAQPADGGFPGATEPCSVPPSSWLAAAQTVSLAPSCSSAPWPAAAAAHAETGPGSGSLWLLKAATQKGRELVTALGQRGGSPRVCCR